MTKTVLAALLCWPLLAAPVLTELRPRGAQQGKTFQLLLTGRELAEGSNIVTSLPAVFTPLTSTMQGLPFLVEMKADAAVGTYPIRVTNASGMSNILMFTVGSFPEIGEDTSPNDSIATAQLVKSVPVIVNGTLRGPDRDFYKVSATAGQRLVFEVEARRCGSAIDPVLELSDAKGVMLARNEDAPGIGVDSRIDYTFARAGDYYIEVHDARFSKQDQNFYRLRIGTYDYPEALFPLGGRHGETVEFEFVTKSGAVKAPVKLPAAGDLAMISMPGSPVLPFTVALSDDAVINGRIAKPGAVDRHKLAVTSGEALLIEVQSRELKTSKLDALVTVLDGTGKKLASAGDTAPANDTTSAQLIGRTLNDPVLNLKVPDGVKEVTITIEDLSQRGGPEYGYRLSVKKRAEDFALTTSPAYLNVPKGGTAQLVVSADRRGYDGPIQAKVEKLPRGWSAEGGFIAPETLDSSGARSASRRGVITITAAPDADDPSAELHVVADTKLADGSMLHRTALGPGVSIDVAAGTGLPDGASTDRQKAFTAPWLNMAVPAAIGKTPLATVEVKPVRRIRMEEGDAFDFEWRIASGDKGLAMPATVSVDAPGARDLRIIDMKATSAGAPTGSFRVTTTKATAPAVYDLIITANLMVEGQREPIYSRAIPFEVTEGSNETIAQPASGK